MPYRYHSVSWIAAVPGCLEITTLLTGIAVFFFIPAGSRKFNSRYIYPIEIPKDGSYK